MANKRQKILARPVVIGVVLILIGYNIPGRSGLCIIGGIGFCMITILLLLFDDNGAKISALQTLAEGGSPEHQLDLGLAYYYGGKIGTTQIGCSYSQAFYWFKKSADGGNTEAMRYMAECYNFGRGPALSHQNAAQCYERAARLGDRHSQYLIGLGYYSGDGVPQDHEAAFGWFLKSANQGNEKAQYCVGICFKNGSGTAENREESLNWFKLASQNGNGNASSEIGAFYYESDHPDHVEALKWFRLAAERGNDDAKMRLSDCYANGWGVPQSFKEAYKWYSSASPKAQSKSAASPEHALKYGEFLRDAAMKLN